MKKRPDTVVFLNRVEVPEAFITFFLNSGGEWVLLWILQGFRVVNIKERSAGSISGLSLGDIGKTAEKDQAGDSQELANDYGGLLWLAPWAGCNSPDSITLNGFKHY
ncbi:MAG: hypothetical protein ACR2PT_16660 [Endozoicomonas sp.]